MDLQMIKKMKNSKKLIMREVAHNFEQSLLDKEKLIQAVEDKRIDDADLYHMMIMQNAVRVHNDDFTTRLHNEIIKRESRMKGKPGDVVMIKGEKHIVTKTENGYVEETEELFKFVAKRFYSRDARRSYFELIQQEMDKYE